MLKFIRCDHIDVDLEAFFLSQQHVQLLVCIFHCFLYFQCFSTRLRSDPVCLLFRFISIV